MRNGHLGAYASREDAGQPTKLHNLIHVRAFAIFRLTAKVLIRLHICPETTFSHGRANIDIDLRGKDTRLVEVTCQIAFASF